MSRFKVQLEKLTAQIESLSLDIEDKHKLIDNLDVKIITEYKNLDTIDARNETAFWKQKRYIDRLTTGKFKEQRKLDWLKDCKITLMAEKRDLIDLELISYLTSNILEMKAHKNSLECLREDLTPVLVNLLQNQNKRALNEARKSHISWKPWVKKLFSFFTQ